MPSAPTRSAGCWAWGTWRPSPEPPRSRISGYFSLYSNNGFVRTFLYLPLLCLLVECVVRSRRFLPIPLLGLATFGCIATGMPEIAFFVLLRRRLWGLSGDVGPACPSRGRGALALAGAFAFGVLLASPLLLLFSEYERISFNVHKGESGTGRGPTRGASSSAGWRRSSTGAPQRHRDRPVRRRAPGTGWAARLPVLAIVGSGGPDEGGQARRAVLRRRQCAPAGQGLRRGSARLGGRLPRLRAGGRADAKPAPGLLLAAFRDHGLDPASSWLVGDRWVDIAAADSADVRAILVERPGSWSPTAPDPPGRGRSPAPPSRTSPVRSS